jgi:hypothetical protein
MIISLLRLSFLTLAGLVLVWSAFLLLPSFAGSAVALENASYQRAYFSAHEQRVMHTQPRDAYLPVRLAGMLLGDVVAFPQAAVLVERRLRVAGGLTPFFLAGLGAAILAGAFLRERLLFGTTYASPSVSFLAKRLAEGALLVFFVWSSSPLPLPYWAFYPALGAVAVGATAYVANLPLRL